MKKRPLRYLLQLSLVLLILVNALGQDLAPADSIVVAVGPQYDKVSRIHKFLLGSHHRAIWAAPVKLRILRVSTERGGLKIIQEGGGMQTRSLRLEDAQKRQWVLRTIQKYPDRKLPSYLKQTVAKDILQDQVSSIHPFSALVVPPLAQALGVPHANPEIVYLADDPGLGPYRGAFSNQVFIFEERAPAEADKTYNTDKVQEKMRADNDNRIDQKTVLRARLLDMLLGDWDRHEDQWRWERITQKDGELYEPVPRDRDQVFYYTDGLFPWFVSHQWLRSKFQGYSGKIRDIKGWNLQAQSFDRYFLNGLSEQDWREQIRVVQETLSDQVIADALRLMPAAVYDISGDWILHAFISRRDLLMRQGLEYYRFISKQVEIPASDKRDLFTLKTDTGKALNVTINKISKTGKVQQTTYDRTFDPAVTREVRLYGFDGSDRFDLSALKESEVKIRIVPGAGVDTVVTAPDARARKSVHVYELRGEQNDLPSARQASVHLSSDSTVHNFDRAGFRYDRFAIVTQANYGVDKGISLIGGFSDEKHGFRKDPYAKRHELMGEYSLARESFALSYKGDFIRIMGQNNLQMNVRSRGPNNVANFFGYGNESVFVNEGEQTIRYYRNRYDFVLADISMYRLIKSWRLSAGLAGQYYMSSARNNKDKFLSEFARQNPQEDVFTNKAYVGFQLNAAIDTRGKNLVRTRGYYWNNALSVYRGIVQSSRRNLYGSSEFGFALNPDNDSVIVIHNRTGIAGTWGTPEFYQRAKLGGIANLRGFHTGRFTGKAIGYNDLDVRVKVLDFNSYLLPGTIGLIGFGDVGRVWMENEKSDKLHLGYGGGLYVIPAHAFLIEATVGFSREGAIPYITLGLKF